MDAGSCLSASTAGPITVVAALAGCSAGSATAGDRAWFRRPFWSPDGRAVAFFADSKLKWLGYRPRIHPAAVASARGAVGHGGGWNAVTARSWFSANLGQPIFQVSAKGGELNPGDTIRTRRSTDGISLRQRSCWIGRHFLLSLSIGSPVVWHLSTLASSGDLVDETSRRLGRVSGDIPPLTATLLFVPRWKTDGARHLTSIDWSSLGDAIFDRRAERTRDTALSASPAGTIVISHDSLGGPRSTPTGSGLTRPATKGTRFVYPDTRWTRYRTFYATVELWLAGFLI